ncbi:MAG: hypothetical protein Q9208_001950 [Pyrenodesmia sp. 3 TL-2023]
MEDKSSITKVADPPPREYHAPHKDFRSYRSAIEHRKFVPEEIYGTEFDCNDFDDPTIASGVILLPCPDAMKDQVDVRHQGCIVVAVDGLPQPDKFPNEITYGVYFAKDSEHNFAAKVDNSVNIWVTKQRAELYACVEALVRVRDMKNALNAGQGVDGLGRGLEWVVIKTDSDYLFQNMTRQVSKWKNQPKERQFLFAEDDTDLFVRLSQELEMLERIGMEVFFWQVPPARNQEAKQLANSALVEVELGWSATRW